MSRQARPTTEPGPAGTDPAAALRPRVFDFGPFEFQDWPARLSRAGVLVPLEPQPARCLEFLLDHAGEVVERQQIRDHIWGEGTHLEDGIVRRRVEVAGGDQPAVRGRRIQHLDEFLGLGGLDEGRGRIRGVGGLHLEVGIDDPVAATAHAKAVALAVAATSARTRMTSRSKRPTVATPRPGTGTPGTEMLMFSTDATVT